MTKSSLQRGILLAAWVAGALFVGTNMVLGAVYQDRIYPGIAVGVSDLSNLTRQQAADVLQRQASAFHIALSVDGNKYDFKPSAVGATYDIPMSVTSAFGIGRNQALPLVGILQTLRPQVLTYSYAVDRIQLRNFVASLSSSQAQAPVDASVVIQNGVPKVQADKSGLGINKLALEAAIVDGIDAQSEQVTVTRSEIAADIRQPQAETAAEAAKRLMATQLSLTYQEKSFKPTPVQIGAWLTFNKKDDGSLAVGVDSAKLEAYFGSFASQVEIAAIPKKINAVNGEVKDTQDGVNGLAIDKPKLAGQISSGLTAGTASSFVIPTTVVAFKTIYNNSISIDAARYIEVNLSTQHLWAYQDHQVAYESAVTSGATGAGYPTVTGLFAIYGKETDRYLNGRNLGYNYNVFVHYWMPFYADYGLHDASWRNGVFGGQDYYYNGSHGCINLPDATAAWLFNWAPIGTPVWVHT